jgi:hypothetical protein
LGIVSDFVLRRFWRSRLIEQYVLRSLICMLSWLISSLSVYRYLASRSWFRLLSKSLSCFL